MNIIDPNTTPNSLSILPRSFDAGTPITLVFRNHDTNEITTLHPTLNDYVGNELVILVEFPTTFSEGERYTYQVKQGSKIIYKGQALITEFNQNNYTLNNNEFSIDIDTDADELKVYE